MGGSGVERSVDNPEGIRAPAAAAVLLALLGACGLVPLADLPPSRSRRDREIVESLPQPISWMGEVRARRDRFRFRCSPDGKRLAWFGREDPLTGRWFPELRTAFFVADLEGGTPRRWTEPVLGSIGDPTRSEAAA